MIFKPSTINRITRILNYYQFKIRVIRLIRKNSCKNFSLIEFQSAYELLSLDVYSLQPSLDFLSCLFFTFALHYKINAVPFNAAFGCKAF